MNGNGSLGNEFLQTLNGAQAEALFETLYGKEGVLSGKLRYAALIEELLNDAAFPYAQFPETRSPLRLFTAAGRTELGGNHTDHNRGRVLAAAVHLDIAAVVAPRSDGRVFFRSKGHDDVCMELFCADGTPNLDPKEAEVGTTAALIRGIAAEFAEKGAALTGFTVNADSTVHSGSGLSSSAAVETLFGRIFNNLYYGGRLSALEIAQIGQRAENRYFGKPCGLMDQCASAVGGAVAIDFANPVLPLVTQLEVDFSLAGYVLCVVHTGGSHADLTDDYAAIPQEMKAVAAFFGKDALRDCTKEAVINHAAQIRAALGDRALLRAFHFFDEDSRAVRMVSALKDFQKSPSFESPALAEYFSLIHASGDSSWQLLQNVSGTQDTHRQGIAVALAMTKQFLSSEAGGACRVHGGGFAGTIQAYIPQHALQRYSTFMDAVFGHGSVTPLRIRSIGAQELFF